MFFYCMEIIVRKEKKGRFILIWKKKKDRKNSSRKLITSM